MSAIIRDDSLLKRYEVLVAGAFLSSHVITGDEGFRPRDLRFYIELFSNWVECSFGGGVIQIANTQVCRYLSNLVSEGYARKKTVKKQVAYHLTRTGLLEMISRLMVPDRIQPFELFCFQVYLAKSYGVLARKEIEREGKSFPVALRIEVDELLDLDKLFTRRQSYIEKELRKLQERAKDGIDSCKLAIQLFNSGNPLYDVVEKIKAHHPYHMSSQKSLEELVMVLPKEIQEWELKEGSRDRAELIWNPIVAALKTELASMEKMRTWVEK